MRSLKAAFGLFTLIPVSPFEVDRVTAARAMRALPWAGLCLGLVAGLLVLGGQAVGVPLLGAMLALAWLAAVTGALHLDGVADTADGLGSRKPPDEALKIMRQSDIGPMGVVTLTMVLLIDAAAIFSLPTGWAGVAAVVAAPMVARAAVTMATSSKVSARQQGFGALFVGVTSTTVAWVSAASVLLVCFLLGLLGGGWLTGLLLVGGAVVAGLVAAAWGKHLVRRLGGWTGDTFGSLIEITQLVFLGVSAILFGAIA